MSIDIQILNNENKVRDWRKVSADIINALTNFPNISNYTLTVDLNESPEKPIPENKTILAGLTNSGYINVVWNSDFNDSKTKSSYVVTSERGRYNNTFNVLYKEQIINNVYSKGSSDEITIDNIGDTNWQNSFYINSSNYGIINKDGFDGIYYTIDVDYSDNSGMVFKLISFAETNNFTSGTYTFCSKALNLATGISDDSKYLIGQIHMDFIPISSIDSLSGDTTYNDTEYIGIDRNTFYIKYRLCSKEFYDYYNKYNLIFTLTDTSVSDSIPIQATVSIPTVNYRLLKLEERIDYIEHLLYDYVMYEKPLI